MILRAVFCILGLACTHARADIILVDEFNDASGGIPNGWSQQLDAGLADEQAGGLLSLSDPMGGLPTLLVNTDISVDVSDEAPVTMEIAVDSLAGSLIFGVTSDPLLSVFSVSFSSTGDLEVNVSENIGIAFEDYSVGNLAGYTGGSVDLGFEFDATQFRVTADDGTSTLDSGLLDFATEFALFTPTDLTNAANFVIGTDGGNVFFDRVEGLDATVPEPKAYAFFAILGAFIFGLQQRRKMAAQDEPKNDTEDRNGG